MKDIAWNTLFARLQFRSSLWETTKGKQRTTETHIYLSTRESVGLCSISQTLEISFKLCSSSDADELCWDLQSEGVLGSAENCH